MIELMKHLENGKTLGYVTLAAVIFTIITHLMFKKHRYVKYFPGLIITAIGVYSLYKVSDNLTANASVSGMLMFLMGFLGGIIALFTALIIGIYEKPRRIKKAKKVKEKEDNESKQINDHDMKIVNKVEEEKEVKLLEANEDKEVDSRNEVGLMNDIIEE